MVNIASTLVSNSTQLDNVDLMGGPRVFTITAVDVSDSEQPVSVRLAEYDRPWKPGLTMRRLMAEMYGSETDEWVGKRVRLFRDEKVSFGRDKTGGTRISHASDLSRTIVVTLPISKGKFGEFTVQPLPDAPPAPTQPTGEDVAASTDVAALKAAWTGASADIQALIVARVAELNGAGA